MTRPRWFVIATVAALIAPQCSYPSAQSRPVPTAEVPADAARALREAIDLWAATPGHRGVSASVVFADGAQWDATAGLAGPNEMLRPDHLLLIASITKTMTGALILQLVDEGIVRLDDPIGRWLPPHRNVEASITVRQLLHHTNGLANYVGSAALSAAITVNRARIFTADELLEFVGLPRFAPGARTEYNNTGFILLGLIAESATGRSLVELYHDRLWDPLALSEIFLPGMEEPPGHVAETLVGSAIVWPLNRMGDLTAGNAAGGVLSNARTVASWGRALFLGRVISAERQREMRTLVDAAGNIPGETGAGLGIRAYHYLDRMQFGHSGGSAMGSSLMLFDPETEVTVAVVMNQGQGADHFVLAPRLLEIAAGQARR